MTVDLKRYPAYKDSGVQWLGEISAHWQVRPLKRWVRINSEVLPEDTQDDFEFRYVDIGSVGTGILTSKPKKLRFGGAPSRARRVLRRGDTIVSTVRPYLKAVYFVAEDASDLIASTGFAVVTPGKDVDPRFLSFLLRSDPFTDRMTANSVGIAYPAITETRLGTFHIAMPPLPEQHAIIRYLDYMDRRIRRYIRAKQKLIALLEEQKQAIIHQAVTRGLDPTVRLKPSGLEWLGDVPEHWERFRLKTILKSIDRRSTDGEQPLLSLRQDHGIVRYDEHFARPPQAATTIGYKIVEVGQIVVNRLQANNGLIFRAGIEGLVSPDYSVFEVRDYADPEFLARLIRTSVYKAHFRRVATGLGTGTAGFLRLYDDDLLDTLVYLPPVEHQLAIVEFLDRSTADTTGVIDRTQREIALLREYRTRLIADVVTGQVDVRAVAAQLPEEAEEMDTMEQVEELAEDEEGEGQFEDEEVEA